MNGFVGANVIASLIAANGAPSVKSWARAVEEQQLFISILTLAEYDKGIANLRSTISTSPAMSARAMPSKRVSWDGLCPLATKSCAVGARFPDA